MNDTEKEPLLPNDDTPDTVGTSAGAAGKSGTSSFSKKRIVVVGVLLIVFLLAALVYFLVPKGKPTQQNDTNKASVPASSQVVSTIAVESAETPIYASSMSAIGGQDTNGLLVYDIAPYRVQGSSYAVLPDGGGDGLAIAIPDVSVQTRYESFAKNFEKGGLRPVDSSVIIRGALSLDTSASVDKYTVYVSDKAVCSLASLTNKTVQGARIVSIGCADMANYLRASESVKPFYESYRQSAGSKAMDKSFYGSPETRKSDDGMEKATMYHGQNPNLAEILHFEKTQNASQWKFVKADPIK